MTCVENTKIAMEWGTGWGHSLSYLVCLRGGLPVLRCDDRQAHLALLVHIRVVDAGLERDLWGLEGVLGGKLGKSKREREREKWRDVVGRCSKNAGGGCQSHPPFFFAHYLNVDLECTFGVGRGVWDQQPLPLQDVLFVDLDVSERLESRLAQVLKLFLKASGGCHPEKQFQKRHFNPSQEDEARTN